MMNRHSPQLLRTFCGGLLIATLSPAIHAASLPDSGLALCDDGTNTMVPCSNANAGDAAIMPRQDGRFGRDPANVAGASTKTGAGAAGFDYTKISNAGTVLGASATLGSAAANWACTRDNLTRLVWEVKTTDSGLRDNGWTYTWYSADGTTNGGQAGTADTGAGVGSDDCLNTARCDTEKYVADVNAAALCGFSDWRLPSRRELESLSHFGASNPAIDPAYFPNAVNGSYWSASSALSSAALAAWGITLQSGKSVGMPKSSAVPVRLVRGGGF